MHPVPENGLHENAAHRRLISNTKNGLLQRAARRG
jgi:hypothetical protein